MLNCSIFFILFFLVVSIVIFLTEKLIRYYFDIVRIKNYESYLAVLDYYMKRAYSIIYKEQILIYSIEATAPTPELLNKAMKDYLNLTLKMLGPKVKQQYVDFFGNEDTLYFNIIEFFNSNIEHDEIKKASVENLMADDST